MSEIKPIVFKLSKDEVKRRIARFRDGCQMSRREFGNVQMIRQNGEVVGIYTDKHTVYIPLALWNDLGTVGEEAAANHEISKMLQGAHHVAAKH